MKELSYDELLQKHKEEQMKKKEAKGRTEPDTSRDFYYVKYQKDILIEYSMNGGDTLTTPNFVYLYSSPYILTLTKLLLLARHQIPNEQTDKMSFSPQVKCSVVIRCAGENKRTR